MMRFVVPQGLLALVAVAGYSSVPPERVPPPNGPPAPPVLLTKEQVEAIIGDLTAVAYEGLLSGPKLMNGQATAACAVCGEIAVDLVAMAVDGGEPRRPPPGIAGHRRGRTRLAATSSAPSVLVLATASDDGATRVLPIRVDPAGPATLTVNLSGGAASTATLVRLTAPGLDGTGSPLGGQTWDGSVNGSPEGTASDEPLTPAEDSWPVDLPAYQAAVVTFRP
jgi:hypothetical protein